MPLAFQIFRNDDVSLDSNEGCLRALALLVARHSPLAFPRINKFGRDTRRVSRYSVSSLFLYLQKRFVYIFCTRTFFIWIYRPFFRPHNSCVMCIHNAYSCSVHISLKIKKIFSTNADLRGVFNEINLKCTHRISITSSYKYHDCTYFWKQMRAFFPNY